MLVTIEEWFVSTRSNKQQVSRRFLPRIRLHLKPRANINVAGFDKIFIIMVALYIRERRLLKKRQIIREIPYYFKRTI